MSEGAIVTVITSLWLCKKLKHGNKPSGYAIVDLALLMTNWRAAGDLCGKIGNQLGSAARIKDLTTARLK